jgi:hypothetical protein
MLGQTIGNIIGSQEEQASQQQASSDSGHSAYGEFLANYVAGGGDPTAAGAGVEFAGPGAAAPSHPWWDLGADFQDFVHWVGDVFGGGGSPPATGGQTSSPASPPTPPTK